MKEKVFSTDIFLSSLSQTLDDIASSITNDIILDAKGIALKFNEDDDRTLDHMIEIGALADMVTSVEHDIKTLFNEFDKRFRFTHRDGKYFATALDAMRIITEIGNDIGNIAPHVEWLFEPHDMTLQNIFNDSFITAE